MPIYEYKCKACGNKFEELVRNEEVEVRCGACGQDTERLMSSNNAITTPWSPSVPKGNYTL